MANYELWRIGFNDISWSYMKDSDTSRSHRAKALLTSVLYTFLQPNGAMRNTQNPHIVDLEGVISTSYKPVPAITVSPINDEYRSQIKEIRTALGPVVGIEATKIEEFNSLQGFTEKMTSLMSEVTPYNVTTEK